MYSGLVTQHLSCVVLMKGKENCLRESATPPKVHHLTARYILHMMSFTMPKWQMLRRLEGWLPLLPWVYRLLPYLPRRMLFYSDISHSWCVPFPAPDRALVRCLHWMCVWVKRERGGTKMSRKHILKGYCYNYAVWEVHFQTWKPGDASHTTSDSLTAVCSV